MTDPSIDLLKQSVESEHGGTATFVQSVAIHEEHAGQTVWDGFVTVFDLKGSPTGAFRAYACSDQRADGKARFVTVLHTPRIVGPRQAIGAAILARQEENSR